MEVEPSRSSIQDGSRYDDMGAIDGFEMQTAGAMYVTHAVTRLQGSPYLGRSAVVELVAGLGKVLRLQLVGLLHLLYLLGPRLGL